MAQAYKAMLLTVLMYFFVLPFSDLSSALETELDESELLDINWQVDYSQSYRAEVFPTQNSQETSVWRKKLIRAAQSSILISGSYCGGSEFVQVLQELQRKLEEKKELKVVLLCDQSYVYGKITSNGVVHTYEETLNHIISKYPENFLYIPTSVLWSGISRIGNHAKLFCIDGGRYFIQGGSGVQDPYVKTGLLEITEEDYLNKNYPDYLEYIPNPEDLENSPGWLGNWLPNSFRDMDFVFKSMDTNLGKKIMESFLVLAQSWQTFKEEKFLINPKNGVVAISHPILIDISRLKNDGSDPRIDYRMKSGVERFYLEKKPAAVKLKMFFSGPQKFIKIDYYDLIGSILDSAKNEIWVGHMYFYPSKLMDKFVAAANRGVKIKIVTEEVFSGKSSIESALSIRNKVNSGFKKNVKLYIFDQGSVRYHKKVIVVDSHVFSGSSNFSYKSMLLNSDYELNIYAESEVFARRVIRIINEDIKHSREFIGDSQSFLDNFKSWLWRIGIRFWG
jgi:phosphatidylserine/phosphatidylglycerophosphate/cardiolipin synthase-like enzyme